MIISSRCNIKQFTDTWALRRKLTLKEILIDCKAYQRKERASKDFDQLGLKSKESGVETTQVNAPGSGVMNGVKKQKGNNSGKKGGHGANNRGEGKNVSRDLVFSSIRNVSRPIHFIMYIRQIGVK